MARFLRNAISLSEWVRSHGTVRKAIDAISSLPGMQKESLTDITEMTRKILSGENSDNAANTLFRLFASHGITEDQAENASQRADQAQAADDLLQSKVITADEHGKMLKQAQIMRQPGQYDMPLRMCPKLPWSVGKKLISTYNCRHYCIDSLVLDEDPMRVYCLEAMWRRHVMDKFSREWKDRETGKWVGGYINDRFFSFPTAGTPANPDTPRDGGNPLQLKPGERTRQPRPHQWSTERRLQEQRDPKSTEAIVLAQAGEGNMIKLASSDADAPQDGIYQAFSEAIRLNKDGVPAAEAALAISEACKIPIGMVVRIQEAAIRKVAAHVSDVYQMDKTADFTEAALDVAQDAKELGLTEKTKTQTAVCPRCGAGYDPKGPAGHKCQQKMTRNMSASKPDRTAAAEWEEGLDASQIADVRDLAGKIRQNRGHKEDEKKQREEMRERFEKSKADKELSRCPKCFSPQWTEQQMDSDDPTPLKCSKCGYELGSEPEQSEEETMASLEAEIRKKHPDYPAGFLTQDLDVFVCKECGDEVFGGIEDLRDHLEELHNPSAANMTSEEVSARFNQVTPEAEEAQEAQAAQPVQQGTPVAAVAATHVAPGFRAKVLEIMSKYPNAMKAFHFGKPETRMYVRQANIPAMGDAERIQFAEDVMTIVKGVSHQLSVNEYSQRVHAVEAAKASLARMNEEFARKPKTQPVMNPGTIEGLEGATASADQGKKTSDGGSSTPGCGCPKHEGERRQGPAVPSSGAQKACPCKHAEPASQG